MRDLEIRCEGATWSEDVAPHCDRLRRYYLACFRGDREQETRVDEAIGLVLEHVHRHWCKGLVLTLRLRRFSLNVRRGDTLVGVRKDGGCSLRRPLDLSTACPLAVHSHAAACYQYTEADIRLDLADERRKTQAWVRLKRAGRTYAAIAAAYRVHDREVRRAVQSFGRRVLASEV